VLLAGAAGSRATDTQVDPVLAGGVVGILVFAVVGVLFYAIFGWIITAIVVALFNFVAGRIGGLQADVVFETPLPGGTGTGYAMPGSNRWPATRVPTRRLRATSPDRPCLRPPRVARASRRRHHPDGASHGAEPGHRRDDQPRMTR
jgi:hypothetical protein